MLEEVAFAAQQTEGNSPLQEGAPPPDYFDRRIIDFWTKSVPAGKQRGGDNYIPDPTKIPEFLIYTDDQDQNRGKSDQGFRTIAEIHDSELIERGDVTVSLYINQLRCSQDDLKKSANLKAATLRVNMQQQKPLLEVLGVLAFPLIAGIFSKGGKGMPPITAPSVNTGARIQNVPLPGGSAKWAWNVFAQHEQSFLGKFIQFALKEAEQIVPIIGPLLSFPAITKPALQAV
jgi:hypothetical protein